ANNAEESWRGSTPCVTQRTIRTDVVGAPATTPRDRTVNRPSWALSGSMMPADRGGARITAASSTPASLAISIIQSAKARRKLPSPICSTPVFGGASVGFGGSGSVERLSANMATSLNLFDKVVPPGGEDVQQPAVLLKR